MWIVDIFGWKSSNMQLIFSSVSALALGLYAFTIPPCKPLHSKKSNSLIETLGLDALFY